jgi:2-polyprenyl-3-methyl-5-hydroxy-6-metoxy-1,4-benzoquinol methylase
MMARMYQKLEFDEEYFRPYHNDKKRLASYQREVAWIRKRTVNVIRVLDFGCGLGYLSKELLRIGFEVFSCDVSPYAVNFCKKHVNPRTFVIPSKNLEGISTGEFDLIVMRGVFQHLSSPTETLMQLKEMTKIGGYIAILATPNIESIQFRVNGELPALSWDLVRNLPSSSSIRHALEYADFEVVDIDKPYIFSGYASPAKDLFAFLANMLRIKKFGIRAFPGNMINVLGKRSR